MADNLGIYAGLAPANVSTPELKQRQTVGGMPENFDMSVTHQPPMAYGGDNGGGGGSDSGGGEGSDGGGE